MTQHLFCRISMGQGSVRKTSHTTTPVGKFLFKRLKMQKVELQFTTLRQLINLNLFGSNHRREGSRCPKSTFEISIWLFKH